MTNKHKPMRPFIVLFVGAVAFGGGLLLAWCAGRVWTIGPSLDADTALALIAVGLSSAQCGFWAIRDAIRHLGASEDEA